MGKRLLGESNGNRSGSAGKSRMEERREEGKELLG